MKRHLVEDEEIIQKPKDFNHKLLKFLKNDFKFILKDGIVKCPSLLVYSTSNVIKDMINLCKNDDEYVLENTDFSKCIVELFLKYAEDNFDAEKHELYIDVEDSDEEDSNEKDSDEEDSDEEDSDEEDSNEKDINEADIEKKLKLDAEDVINLIKFSIFYDIPILRNFVNDQVNNIDINSKDQIHSRVFISLSILWIKEIYHLDRKTYPTDTKYDKIIPSPILTIIRYNFKNNPIKFNNIAHEDGILNIKDPTWLLIVEISNESEEQPKQRRRYLPLK